MSSYTAIAKMQRRDYYEAACTTGFPARTGFTVCCAASSVQSAPVLPAIFYYGITLAVAFIILALSSTPLIKLLSLNFISFLGKISYSLYLYHFIVFLTLAYTIQPYIPYWLFGLLTLAISILAATASYYAVEKPAMALGRRLSSYATRPGTGRSALPKTTEVEAVAQQI
jgi:peptidoglycan/LPS O-acetylase OafA/YrhL